MKKYIHEKRNQLKSALFHAGHITRQPHLFETILDEDNKAVDPTTITRKKELVGAGIQYVMSIVDYFCTHRYSELQFVEGSAKRVKIPTLTWSMAIDIATAKLPRQRKRAEVAILNLRSAQKPVFFYDFDYDKNGLSYSMVPFIIDLTFDDGEKMATTSAAKLARVIKNKPEQPYKIIKYIDIQFAKPLYEGFFRKGSGNYSFPNGMYAQFFHNANTMKKSVQDNDTRDADTEPYIDFYCRLARYFALHNNLEKGKKHTTLHKTLEDIMTEIYPTMINWKDGEPYIKDIKKADALLLAGFHAILTLDGFGVYPAFEGHTSEGKLIIGLWRTSAEALESMVQYKKQIAQAGP